MPHNRAEREQAIRNRYEFAVFDGEFSLFNGALVAIDAYVTGGTYTIEYIKDTLGDFGRDVVSKMIAAGIDPTGETIYGDVMVFQTWENPIPGVTGRIYGPNKFVPYIAARKIVRQPTDPQEDEYLVGDWTGDGKDKLAVRREGIIMCQSNLADTVARLETGYGDGNSEDQYLVGDWTGDGKDKLAVRRGNKIFYQQNLGDGVGVEVSYGDAGDQYLVGDWTGDGKDKLAVRRGNKIFYQQNLGDGVGVEVSYGDAGDQYLVGDWIGDGKDKLAVRRGDKIFYQQNLGDSAGVEVSYGDAGDQYLVGGLDRRRQGQAGRSPRRQDLLPAEPRR
jgi:hypothetical protein